MTTSPARLRTARFAAQGIAAPGLRPTEVVERMLAVQGQDLGQVLWAIGVRAPGSTRDDVREAFDRGELVRSWPMRGTLHALRPDDLRLLLDEWAPATAELPDRDEALRRVLLGYLRGRGPATEADAASWTKLPLGDLRRARAAAGDAVEDLGDGLLDLADRPAAARIPTGHLLPGFDEYLLGYADRSAQLDPAHADRVVPGANGMFLPMAVVRGRVVGTWKRTERRAGHLVTVTPFGALDASSVRALEAAAARYAAFLGAPVATTVV